MSSEGKSSGPSSNDPGVAGLWSGGGGGTASGFDAPIGDASSGFNAGVNPPTLSSTLGAPPAAPAFSIGTSGEFDAGGGTAIPGSTGSPVSPTASLANTAGFSTPAAPGVVAPITGNTGSPTDIGSFYDPSNPASSPLSGAPGGTPSGTALTPSQLGATDTTSLSAKQAPAPQQSGGSGSILDSLGIKNPLGAAIGAGGLAYSVLSNKAPKFSPELEAQAKSLNASGQQLLSYLQSGSLPPGLQASLDQATKAAKAKIISNFASQGLNADPAKNSALAAELAQVDQAALISTAQVGQQLLSAGQQEVSLSSDVYKTLAQIDQTQTANISKAIASFASAISGGGGGGLNLQLAKS